MPSSSGNDPTPVGRRGRTPKLPTTPWRLPTVSVVRREKTAKAYLSRQQIRNIRFLPLLRGVAGLQLTLSSFIPSPSENRENIEPRSSPPPPPSPDHNQHNIYFNSSHNNQSLLVGQESTDCNGTAFIRDSITLTIKSCVSSVGSATSVHGHRTVQQPLLAPPPTKCRTPTRLRPLAIAHAPPAQRRSQTPRLRSGCGRSGPSTPHDVPEPLNRYHHPLLRLKAGRASTKVRMRPSVSLCFVEARLDSRTSQGTA